MKILASLLFLGVSALPINATIDEELVAVSAEDIEKKRSPVFFAVHRVGDKELSFDFVLKEPAGRIAEVGPYLFCQLEQPVHAEEMPFKLSRGDSLARAEVGRNDRATFDLRRDDIPRSALVVYVAEPSPEGFRRIRGYCLPLAEMLKTVKLEARHPMPAKALRIDPRAMPG